MEMRRNLAIILLALALTACDKHPRLRMVTIYTPNDTQLADMVDLRLFTSLAPGITFDEAQEILGAPAETEKGSNLTEYHYYFTNGLRLAVAKEIQASGSMPRIEWWTVYAFPTNRTLGISPDTFLSKAAVEQIRSEKAPFILVVRDTADDSSVWCTVKRQGMTEIRWLNTRSRKL